jgi:hypothetical protein
MSEKNSVWKCVVFFAPPISHHVRAQASGNNQLPKVILGVKFTDGIEVVRSQAQTDAA